MDYRGSILFLCVVAMQLVHVAICLPPVDPEMRAKMEAEVMSQLSLKHLEEMVEKDERVQRVQSPPLIIIPKPKDLASENDDHYNSKAYIIHKKPKKSVTKKLAYTKPQHKIDREEVLMPYEPQPYRFEGIKFDDDVPAWFDGPELEPAASNPSFGFYESIAESIMNSQKSRFPNVDPFSVLDIASSDDMPYYRPRFNYDAYSKDSLDTKLNGKSYWRDAPERRDEKVDDKGCRMVVKKIMDPEDEKKATGAKPKSVIITKECEYPSIDGPDAKIPNVQNQYKSGQSRLDSEPLTVHDSYDRPSEDHSDKSSDDDTEKATPREPLEPGYIDRMLESHFKSFPTFSNPISSFQGYQDRFKLSTPQRFREIKPTIGVQSYDYSHPTSGFESHAAPAADVSAKEDDAPRTYEHHYHYDHPEKSGKDESRYDDDSAEDAKTSGGKKDPKMVKKTFAYYRKDNPKDDPNDHQFAEEYAQGNYRSFSTDYDSERDGPKKQ